MGALRLYSDERARSCMTAAFAWGPVVPVLPAGSLDKKFSVCTLCR